MPLFSWQWEVNVSMNGTKLSTHYVQEKSTWWMKSLCESKPTTGMIYDIPTPLTVPKVVWFLQRSSVATKPNQCLLIQSMIEVMQVNSPIRLQVVYTLPLHMLLSFHLYSLSFIMKPHDSKRTRLY